MYPLVYSKFCFYKIDPHDLDVLQPQVTPSLGEGCLTRSVGIGIDEPACQVCYEDFFPGGEYRWTTWIDQIDVVTLGKAEITVWHPPEFEKKTTLYAEAPCIYLLPRGTRILWRVLGEEVFRHFSIDIPNPGFPLLDAQSLEKA
jgi:hypothetical protein